MQAFATYHPAALALFFLSVLLLSMFTTHPVLLGLSLVGGICFCAVWSRRENSGAAWYFAWRCF
ncbi:MAG: hypothetical protein ACLSAP_02810 [Oscillospiraceae bacterium]